MLKVIAKSDLVLNVSLPVVYHVCDLFLTINLHVAKNWLDFQESIALK